MDFNYLFTSFDGRINRKPYWISVLVLVAIVIVITLVLNLIGFSMESRAFKIISFVIQLVLLYPSAALMVKRLHDRDRPSYFVAFMLVPLVLQGLTNALDITGDPTNQNVLDYIYMVATLAVAIWFFVELGCLRGTVGDNQYGPDPLATPSPALGR